jgi:hypothetical protein
MSELRCNVCDQAVPQELVSQHVSGRNHSIRKKVAEYNEMNSQVRPSYRDDISIVRAWIRDLYKYDYLTSSAT